MLLFLSRRLKVSNPNREQHHGEQYTSPLALASAMELATAVKVACVAVGASCKHFCVMTGLANLTQMLEEAAQGGWLAPWVTA